MFLKDQNCRPVQLLGSCATQTCCHGGSKWSSWVVFTYSFIFSYGWFVPGRFWKGSWSHAGMSVTQSSPAHLKIMNIQRWLRISDSFDIMWYLDITPRTTILKLFPNLEMNLCHCPLSTSLCHFSFFPTLSCYWPVTADFSSLLWLIFQLLWSVINCKWAHIFSHTVKCFAFNVLIWFLFSSVNKNMCLCDLQIIAFYCNLHCTRSPNCFQIGIVVKRKKVLKCSRTAREFLAIKSLQKLHHCCWYVG